MPSSAPEPWLDRILDDVRSHEKERAAVPGLRDAPAEGAVFAGRYQVERRIGGGAAAVVYRAWDRELGRPVALKVLRDPLEANAQVRERFQREARIMAGLSHPNLVAVHDAGESGDRLFLVMELVEGEALGEGLSRRPVDFGAMSRLLEGAARGVGAAHRAGVVHRDLKPANILVGQDGSAKVGDFGLAHVGEGDGGLTRSGAVLGTPLYMSPEQVQGGGAGISPRTDVYALGAILYEALAGVQPHAGGSVTEIFNRIVDDDPVPPRRINPGAPRPLEIVAMKALDRDPGRRYATTDEFADDLRRWRDGEPVAARPVSTVERLWRRGLRHWRVALPTAAVAALAITWAGWELWSAGRLRGRFLETMQRAEYREAQGDLQQARDLYRISMTFAPGNPTAQAGFARVDARLKAAQAEAEALQMTEEARRAIDGALREIDDLSIPREAITQRSMEAIRRLEEALKKSPSLASAWFELGRAWELEGWFDRAEESWRKAVELEPSHGKARYRLGRVIMVRAEIGSIGTEAVATQARRDEAIQGFRRAAEEFEAAGRAGGREDALLNELIEVRLLICRDAGEEARGRALAAAARFGNSDGVEELLLIAGYKSLGAERIRLFDEAVRRRPVQFLGCFFQGLDRFQRLLFAPAVESLTVSLRANPRFFGTWYLRSMAKGFLGDYAGGLDDAEAAVAINPSAFEGYNQRGMMRLRREEWELAEADFDRVVQARPQVASGWANRALARQGRRNLDGALADANEAVRVDPISPTAWGLRGIIRQDRGDIDAAIKDFEYALQIAAPTWDSRPAIIERLRLLRARER